MTQGEVEDRIQKWYCVVLWPWAGTLGLTNNHSVKPMNRSLWLVWRGANVSAVDSGDSVFLTTRQQPEQRGDAAWRCFSNRAERLHCVGCQFCMCDTVGEKEPAVTYVTAYCAKDRYSTNTSRPLLSSFRNSLTHLKAQKPSLITQQHFSTV